jgi:hypothetical protein
MKPAIPQAAPVEHNASLREIAGRIKKLSYRDATAFGSALRDALPSGRSGTDSEVTQALLTTADKLETA